ncbi:MAG TPA: kynureninase [Gaiellales bacterium]|jgi:kynureninase
MTDWMQRAAALDAADPLAPFRARFVHADAPRVYLDGNSLGRMPVAAAERIEAVVQRWSSELVGGWHQWIDVPVRTGDLLAEAVLGARAGEVLACDSTTVNLYKLALAAIGLASDRRAIVTDRDNFPTDRYVLEGIAGDRDLELRVLECDPVDGPQAAEVAEACAGGDVALVTLSHVAYRSGALADIRAISEAAHAGGALVLWDLSHSAGSVPVDLHASGADLAVGCTYKYLNAGPGAPAYLYVRRELQESLRSPIQGWFGQREQFEMERPYDPEEGIRRFHAGTPPIIGLAAVDVGAELVGEAGIEAIRAKAGSLTSLAIEYLDAELAPLGFELGTPRAPERRGAHVSLRHPEAWRICRALIERADVVPDFRGPDSVRLGFSPLYTRHADVLEGLERLRDLVAREVHLDVPPERARVT